ncbi:hypothetical protein KCP78_03270 [Salmonella enterica subsp. enterica]|nr:hypothetical protein KCP78_03270 [Salmonella enterica subsp. enterica]
MGLPVSVRERRSLNLSYRPDTTRDEPVIVALQAVAERYPRVRFSKNFSSSARRQGYPWNHKATIVFIVCRSRMFAVKANNGCRVILATLAVTPEAPNQMARRFYVRCSGLWPSLSHVRRRCRIILNVEYTTKFI